MTELIIIGAVSAISSGFILVPDVIKTVQLKRNQMSRHYLVAKSVSVCVNIGYGSLLAFNFGVAAGLPILLTMGVKTVALIIFACYSTVDNDETSPLLVP